MKKFIAGKNINQGTYKSFQPVKINRQWDIEDIEIITLLTEADRELGRLDMYSEYLPNINIFIRMHIAKEATQSNKIEGTQTNIEETLLEKEDVHTEKRDDWDEVHNYILALNVAIKDLKELPFSSRLIKSTHKVLLKGVRGKHKQPGKFRRSQNWIGGNSIKNASFIPPSFDSIDDCMADLEKFVHNDKFIFPDLLKVALIHYQFETIHPFLDGNGRVGRLLIILYLVEKGILKRPVLYLSDYFERNRTQYYESLTAVREKNDLTQWFKFFLRGVDETAKSSIDTFDKVLKLQKETESKIQDMGSRIVNAQLLITELFRNPITDAQKAKKVTGLSLPSVYKLIADLENFNILKEITGSKRGKLYAFREYIDIFK